MSAVWLIARRELGAYVRSPLGYIVVAAVLLIDGLFFNTFALGQGLPSLGLGAPGDKRSSDVLMLFFWFSSGTTLVASVFISMRLFAEEKQTGTLPLLLSAPVTDAQIVLGKFLSAFVFLSGMTLLTAYMPALIFVNGRVALGHIAAGYLGLVLLGGAALAVGVLGSALAPNQVIAAIASGVMLLVLLMAWLLGFVAERPLNDVFSYLALWHKHFQPFRDGVIHLRDVLYYLTVTYVFLHASTRVLQARRWR